MPRHQTVTVTKIHYELFDYFVRDVFFLTKIVIFFFILKSMKGFQIIQKMCSYFWYFKIMYEGYTDRYTARLKYRQTDEQTRKCYTLYHNICEINYNKF